MANYIVLQPIWHTKDLQQYDPGESVTLDHLDGNVIEDLIKQEVVALDDGTGNVDTIVSSTVGGKGKKKKGNSDLIPQGIAGSAIYSGGSPEGGLNG